MARLTRLTDFTHLPLGSNMLLSDIHRQRLSMYKAIVVGLFGLLLISTHAMAQCSSYPNPLTNGTTASGYQVMQNFNCAVLQSGATINAATLTGVTAFPSGVITSSGSIGIGTTSPNEPLDVYSSSTSGNIITRYNDAAPTVGSGIAIGALATNQPFVGFRVSDQSQRFQVNVASVNTSTERLTFSGDCGGGCGMTEYFSINKGGYIGIGTTSPANPLDIVESVSANVRLKSTSSGQASLDLDGATGYSSQIYNAINGTTIWASGITGNGSTNSYSFFNYGLGAAAFYISTNGNATLDGCLAYNGGTLGTCLSDERIKKNIRPFTLGLSEIIGLKPVSYQYNGLGDIPADGKVRTGLIAQQVQKSAPELVQTTKVKLKRTDSTPTPLLEVRYGDLAFALINAIKELKAANDSQASEIRELRQQIAENDNQSADIQLLKKQVRMLSQRTGTQITLK